MQAAAREDGRQGLGLDWISGSSCHCDQITKRGDLKEGEGKAREQEYVHISATVGKPRDINAGLHSVSPFYLVQDSSPQGWRQPHSGKVFPTQLDLSRNTLPDSP